MTTRRKGIKSDRYAKKENVSKTRSDIESSLSWQHPFVDVFRVFDLALFKSCEKKGDVRAVTDELIRKRVYRISGTISASNYIKIPRRKKVRANQVLGKDFLKLKLVGRFAYFVVRGVPTRDATIHIDITTESKHGYRLTMSTKVTKMTFRGLNVSVPMTLSSKWSVVAVDLNQIVRRASRDSFKYLRRITLGSSMYVRGVYTSDNMYSSSSLPSKIQFPGSIKDWGELYDWSWVPERPASIENDRMPLTQERERSVKMLRDASIPAALPRAPPSIWTNLRRLSTHPFSLVDENSSERVEEAKRSCVLRPDPICKLRSVCGFNSFDGRPPQFVSRARRDPKKSHTARVNSHTGPLWSYDAKEIVFASANLIVAMRVGDGFETEEGRSEPTPQRYFKGHSRDVGAICLSRRGKLLASAQIGHPLVVRVWKFATAESVCVIAGAPSRGAHGAICLDFSVDSSLLCVAGRDDHGRQQIVLWDVSKVISGGAQKMVARQTSEYDVRRIYFSPFDPRRLVSCGEENIRFWRVRRRHLPAAAVVLNEYTRGALFTDLAFESSLETDIGVGTESECGYRRPKGAEDTTSFSRRIFVSSALGTVLQINYDTRGLECVFQLHDGPIHAIRLHDGYCATASTDKMLRVWPLDFSDFFLEACHDGSVVALDVSPDGHWLATAANDGTMGVMNVVAQKYTTVLRIHRGEIRALSLSGNCPDNSGDELIATISDDANIRVWLSKTMEQQYEFSTNDDMPTSVQINPRRDVSHVICGFRSGHLRVFDMDKTMMLHEMRPHRCAILSVASGPQGRRVFSYGAENQLCQHDACKRYETISTISVVPTSTKGNGRVSNPVQADMQISSNGELLAIAGSNIGHGRVLIYDVKTLTPTLNLHADVLRSPFSKIRFAPVVVMDGKDDTVNTTLVVSCIESSCIHLFCFYARAHLPPHHDS